jgi:hypothetical protein
MATERHRRNNISSLTTDHGSVITEHYDKNTIIYQPYKDRLGTTFQFPMLFHLASLIQPAATLEELSVSFTTHEINEVIRTMTVEKALGPDGFNGQFLKNCWHIIKEDIYKLFFDFYDVNLNLESINMAHITLVPKVQSPTTINDFRPITLLNCVLKILKKLLANRLQNVVLRIVHKNQYGFLKVRNIRIALHGNLSFSVNVSPQKRKSFY